MFNAQSEEVAFPNTRDLMLFLKSSLNDLIPDITDFNVYKEKGFLFRCVWCSKDKREGIRPLERKSFKGCEPPAEDLKLYFLSYFQTPQVFFTAYPTKILRNLQERYRPLKDEEVVTEFITKMLQSTLKNVAKDFKLSLREIYKYEKKANGDVEAYFVNYKGDCPYLQREHKSNNCYMKVNPVTTIVRCFDKDCPKWKEYTTNTLLKREQYEVLFNKQDIVKDNFSMPYIEKIESGANLSYKVTKKGYNAPVTSAFKLFYQVGQFAQHVIGVENHEIEYGHGSIC